MILALPCLALLSFCLVGCAVTSQTEVITSDASSSSANPAQQAQESCMQKAKLGWYCVYQYSLTHNERLLKDADTLFAQAQAINPQSHHPHWGWGILKGFQAERHAQNPDSALRLRLQALDSLLKAQALSVPQQERPALVLDLANAYNQLATIQLRQKLTDQAKRNLTQARELLTKTMSENPEIGKSYLLMAENCLLQQDKVQAGNYAKMAKDRHVKLPKNLETLLVK